MAGKNDIIRLLLEFIDHAYDKRAWHGPTLRGSIRGISYREAMWRPTPKHHNIRELVLHAAYWKYVVRRRLTGSTRGYFPVEGSNWFEGAKKFGPKEWKKEIALLEEQHKLLRQTVSNLPPSKLRKLDMIHGIAAHDLYHAGQIQLLKRLMRGGVVKPKG